MQPRPASPRSLDAGGGRSDRRANWHGVQAVLIGRSAQMERLRRNLLERVALRIVARKIHQHQFQFVLSVGGELARGQHVVVEFDAPRTPVETGKVKQHCFAVSFCLRQCLEKIGTPA